MTFLSTDYEPTVAAVVLSAPQSQSMNPATDWTPPPVPFKTPDENSNKTSPGKSKMFKKKVSKEKP